MTKKTRKSRFGANVIGDVERQRKAAKGFGYLNLPKNVAMYKETVGRKKLDIIPYVISDENHPDINPSDPESPQVGDAWYKRPIWIHHGVGAAEESLICPKTIKKKCPICEFRDKQFRDGVDRESVIGKPQHRNLYCVIPIGQKDYDDREIYVWDISQFCFQDELNDELLEGNVPSDFPDPVDGKRLSIRFSEESFNTSKYPKANRIDPENRDPYEDEIIDEAPVLDELFDVLSYRELEAKFLEEDIDPEEEIEEDERHTARMAGRKPKKLMTDEETDEETDEDDPDEDDPPKKEARRTRRSAAPKEDDDDPIGADADDEPEPPRRRRRESKAEEKKDSPKGGKCPFKHTFGKDWDEYADCDDCAKEHTSTFNACADAHEE